MKTLLIDNYDSFTYNLFQLLAEVNGAEPIVVRNDDEGWAEIAATGCDNIVISPGPGRPDRPYDFGISADAIREADVPLLGVCLGHQGIGAVFGGTVVHAPEAMHGRLSAVYHDGSPLFQGIPQGFEVVRYHSLCLREPLPDDLQGIAWTSGGVLMALAHRHRPIWGVQFHPESICTEYGRKLLANFRDLTTPYPRRGESQSGGRRARRWPPPRRPRLRVRVERIDRLYDAEQAFVSLYGEHRFAFWLDSSMVDERSRFSFIGGSGGPLSSVVTYDVEERSVTVDRGLSTETYDESIFDYLSREMHRLRTFSDELPFDFNGGFVGYFGYELKADCEGEATYQSPLPDAAFIFADRLIVFDHHEHCVYLVCITSAANDDDGRRWIADVSARLAATPSAPALEESGYEEEPGFHLSRSRQRYLDDIQRVKDYLINGETYEVCLTNKVRTTLSPDPLTLYRKLRRINPAPFSAYLRLGEAAVLSSSPERFLRVGRDRWVEAKPIKGTCRRGHDPGEDLRLAEDLRTDEKSRAENLMITDLLRNDLGVVCEVGTVHVPHLMAIESYKTVHQLVSTVRGRLREDVEPPDGIRACFPGGSMTGAPKKRTMEIIDELEREGRGVYSGALGYLALSGGCDLSIVIRTIVMDGETTTIGTGGAIVMQSDDEAEFEEAMLKAHALVEALVLSIGRPSAEPSDGNAPRPSRNHRSSARWNIA